MSYDSLMKLAIDSVFGPNIVGASVVGALYQNLTGSEAPQLILDQYGDMLDSGSMTYSDFGIAAAETSLNTSNIDLVGLTQTGVEYIL